MDHHYEAERRGLGVRFPPLKERFERVEETVQIVRQMWAAGDGPTRPPLPPGAHAVLASLRPIPIPIMLGGQGSRGR